MVEILTADDLSNDNFYPGEAHTVRGDEHSQGAATINPQAKQTKCDRLERLVDEFLGSGGAITICPPGKPPKFRFGAFKPSPGSSGACRSNDLSRRRWYDPLPNRREERDLIRKAKSGDERAKQKLVETNHRFILTILTEYSGPPHNAVPANVASAARVICEREFFSLSHLCRTALFRDLKERGLLDEEI
jgi:hypothetical protein